MVRYIAAAAAAVLLIVGGILFSRSATSAGPPGPSPVEVRTAALPQLGDPLPEPPAASAKTREEKRFGRVDKDKNGAITTAEYFATRQRAFLKLDANKDGRLSFDEWAIKSREKFAKADADRTGILTPKEFATTAVMRKAKPKCACPPERSAAADGDDEDARN